MKSAPSSAAEMRESRSRHRYEVAGGAVGMLCGAGSGVIAAGPAGALIGALIGGAMGASVGWATQRTSRERAQRDRELDAEIGVTKGDLGIPSLKHPASTTGTYSAASVGASNVTSDATLSEGPILPPPD